jgi:hypothetical protein
LTEEIPKCEPKIIEVLEVVKCEPPPEPLEKVDYLESIGIVENCVEDLKEVLRERELYPELEPEPEVEEVEEEEEAEE